MNYTHIVIIRKKKVPLYISNFCPIILENMVSRVVSKVIANKLKSVLPNVISNAQSAYMANH